MKLLGSGPSGKLKIPDALLIIFAVCYYGIKVEAFMRFSGIGDKAAAVMWNILFRDAAVILHICDSDENNHGFDLRLSVIVLGTDDSIAEKRDAA